MMDGTSLPHKAFYGVLLFLEFDSSWSSYAFIVCKRSAWKFFQTAPFVFNKRKS